MIDQQQWKPPYEIVEVPQDKVKLLFPTNYFSVSITGDRATFSISTDMAALPAVIERLEALLAFMKLGPLPQPAILHRPREGVLGDLMEVPSEEPTPAIEGGKADAA